MGTLSEHAGNGNPIESSRQGEETKERMYSVLQQFEVLPTRFDRLLFQYIYVYLLVLFFLAELLFLIAFLIENRQVEQVLVTVVGINMPPVVLAILVFWRFNVWRW